MKHLKRIGATWLLAGVVVCSLRGQATDDRTRLERELRGLAAWRHSVAKGVRWGDKLASLQPQSTVRAILIDWAVAYKATPFENVPGGTPSSDDFEYLRLAVTALGYLREPRGSAVLAEVARVRTSDRDPIRLPLAQALARIDVKGNQSALVNMLDSTTPREGYLRMYLAETLADSRDWAILSKIEQLAMREQNRRYREAMHAAADRLRSSLRQP